MNKQRNYKTSIEKETASVIQRYAPQTKSWHTGATAQECVALPLLDGELVVDAVVLDEAADDVGHVVHHRPTAVLKPGSIDDIVRTVCFARQHEIKIAARGQGHTTFGQSQVSGGIVIAMNALDLPPQVMAEGVEVYAGTTWQQVLAATLPHTLMPPVITGFLGLSVGGTLSVAGIGGSSYRYGAQVDNVLELQVVTGEGQLVRCSPDHNADLFEAALAGLGQCAIIVRATLRLIRAESHAHVCLLFYADIPTMLHDERLLMAEARFHHIVGYVLPGPNGQWAHFIEAVCYFTPPAAPVDADLFAGLHFIPGMAEISDPLFFDFAQRVDMQIAALTANGRMALPHPWL
ncbi:MAG: FAD-binding protein, partial [Caldilineaceae bacterium]|nr:FAD-binding protein [Caldilineaceae bacterium]